MKKLYRTYLFIFAVILQQTAFAQGPDAYGYTWLSSDDAGGPTYSWIDISTDGTEVAGLADDNSVAFVTMGMDFHYYWSDYNQLKIGSNGWMSFDNVSNISHCFPTMPLPGGNGDNLICPLMGDLNFNGAANPGKVYYHNDGAGKFIVSYLNSGFWVNATPDYVGDNNFQVVFDQADSSITFQYQVMDTELGNPTAACNTDVVVGIENLTGNIGLSVIIDALPASNSAIRFYYPQTILLSVEDVAPSWNQNEKNGGEFYLPYDVLEFTTNISNTGNTDNTLGTAVEIELRNEANANVAYTSSENIPTLGIGESNLLTFAATATEVEPGQYFLETTTTNPGDINPSNNTNATEINVLDTANADLVFSYVSDTPPDGIVSWASSNSGAGIYVKPPQYPTNIFAVEMHIQSATAEGFIAQIWDDSGVDGAPGTMLAEQTVTSGSYADMSWVLVPFDTEVMISSGGFYVAWLDESGAAALAISTQAAGPISRRSFEILEGAWAEYRMSTLADLYIRVLADNTYEAPVSNKDIFLDANVSIFPNPTKDFLTIENNSDQELEEVIIYNTLGEQILRKTTSIYLNGNETIQLDHLDAGIYYVKIRSGNAWMSRKVIVMK
jgi:hypothetical protein